MKPEDAPNMCPICGQSLREINEVLAMYKCQTSIFFKLQLPSPLPDKVPSILKGFNCKRFDVYHHQ